MPKARAHGRLRAVGRHDEPRGDRRTPAAGAGNLEFHGVSPGATRATRAGQYARTPALRSIGDHSAEPSARFGTT